LPKELISKDISVAGRAARQLAATLAKKDGTAPLPSRNNLLLLLLANYNKVTVSGAMADDQLGFYPASGGMHVEKVQAKPAKATAATTKKAKPGASAIPKEHAAIFKTTLSAYTLPTTKALQASSMKAATLCAMDCGFGLAIGVGADRPVSGLLRIGIVAMAGECVILSEIRMFKPRTLEC
jgi:hypothetical protein